MNLRLPAFLALIVLSVPAFAQEPRDEPREIAMLMAWFYQQGQPPGLLELPLVDRLRSALARADIDGDVVMQDTANRMEQVSIGWSQRIDHQRSRVTIRFRERGRPQQVEMLFDRASGPWLITEIRNRDGRSLRKLLQLPTLP